MLPAKWVLPALLVGLAAGPLKAADWPQWRGPQRNGISAETGWLTRWPAAGPKRLWSARVGEGFSSVAVAGGRVYAIGNASNQDRVSCLNAETGKPVWSYAYASPAGDYGGPRATPVLDGGNVYTFSRDGVALCLNAGNGKVVWQKDLRRETGAQPPQWGFAGSPLISGNLAIYNLGAAGTGVDKGTGKIVWRSATEASGYASPLAYTVGNQQGVAIFTASAIAGLNPANGRLLWQFPWQTNFGVNAADPIFSGNTVFISSNYEKGCALLRLGGGQPAAVWQNRNMRNHFNSCVLVGGALYGNDQGTLKCIDLATGAGRWQQRGMGKGGLISAGGNLLVMTERGELLLAKAAPDRYTELARAQVLTGTCWTHPVLANGRIYCRSHEGDLVCLDVRAK
jgi:outer membrane protein assembly factor BamB